ncbi:uncharacterized protein [Lolium perenne]|uniref:uncharacterized protein n=1 Tax=Lolium perenne TaxID=4522 RepID=UPI0021F53EB4|nr:uncharacterized protein LOC127343701 [Lolium perenne]
MGSFVLHMAMKYLEYTLGREDAEGHVLNLAFSSQVLNYLGRIRVPFRTPRIPQTPPRVPPAPSRPGLPIVVGLGGGAILHKAGSFVWSYRWWIGIGLGVCLLGPSVTNYLRRRRSDREQITVNPHAVHPSAATEAYILDGSAILSAYLQEILQSGRFQDLDICEANAFFQKHPFEAQAGALFCVQHLYLQVRNHVDPESDLANLLEVASERVRRVLSHNESLEPVNSDSYSLCVQSKNGKTVALIITGNLGIFKQWYCCSGTVHNAIEIRRPFRDMSYMATRRLPPALQSMCTSDIVFENIQEGPEYIILAGSTVIDVLQNLSLVEFAYQGVRPGIDLRDLCETLHGLSVPSSRPSENILLVIVQFKAPHHPITLQSDDIARRKGKAPMDGGEGTSGSKAQ